MGFLKLGKGGPSRSTVRTQLDVTRVLLGSTAWIALPGPYFRQITRGNPMLFSCGRTVNRYNKVKVEWEGDPRTPPLLGRAFPRRCRFFFQSSKPIEVCRPPLAPANPGPPFWRALWLRYTDEKARDSVLVPTSFRTPPRREGYTILTPWGTPSIARLFPWFHVCAGKRHFSGKGRRCRKRKKKSCGVEGHFFHRRGWHLPEKCKARTVTGPADGPVGGFVSGYRCPKRVSGRSYPSWSTMEMETTGGRA